MIEKREDKSSDILLENILEGIRRVKGKEIVNIDLRAIENHICQNFVICHGDSTTHVNAIADSVNKEMREKCNFTNFHKEGYENSQWVLLDYGGIVVHVFLKEIRDFYRLEELWADGVIQQID